MQAGQLLTKFNHALSAFKKIDELMQTDSRDDLTKDFKAVSLDNGDIKINDLSFDTNEIDLRNISLEINSGEVVGLVGNIGSGKTSLLRNIIGFYLPTKGTVSLVAMI